VAPATEEFEVFRPVILRVSIFMVDGQWDQASYRVKVGPPALLTAVFRTLEQPAANMLGYIPFAATATDFPHQPFPNVFLVLKRHLTAEGAILRS